MSKKSALLSGGRKEEEDSLAEYINMAKNCAFWPELFGNDNAQLVHDDFARRFSMCLNFAAGHSVKWASHFVDTGFIALEVSTLEAGYESISEFLDCSSPSQLSTLFNHTFNLRANSSMVATLEILRDLIQAVGGSNGITTIEEVFKQLAAETPALAGLSLGKIGDLGVQLSL